MKPISLNLSKMKKVAGDDKSSTFQHPNGHQMVIAHNGVSALQRKQLEKMPVQSFDEGGLALDPANLPESSSSQDSPGQIAYESAANKENRETNNQRRNLVDYYKPQEGGLGGQNADDRADKAMDEIKQYKQDPDSFNQVQGSGIKDLQNIASADENDEPAEDNHSQNTIQGPSPASDQTGQISPQAQAAPSSPDSGVDIQKSYQQGQRAISEQQAVDTQKSNSNADIQSKDIAAREQLNKDFQDNYKTFSDHQKAFMDDYMNSHIDPKHYQESMDSGKKVTTGIGLLLGGMSSATTGHNPAAEFLDKQIDRDIKAQEHRIDQKKTILGANREFFQDQMLAHNQTRINMNDMYDRQIQLAASKLGTPQAKANADAMHSKFALENAAILQQSAIRSTALNHLKNGGAMSAIDLSNAGIVPKEEAIKEQASIDAQNTAVQGVKSLYAQADKEQSASNLANPQSYKRMAALNADLVNTIMSASASKRLTPESIKQEIAPLELKTGDNAQTRREKLQRVLNMIQKHADPTPYMQHYSPGSLPKYEGAQSNPMEGKTASDSRGNRIVMKNGRWVPYGG